MTSAFKTLSVSALALAAALSWQAAIAQTPAPAPSAAPATDNVLARVDGEPVTQKDLDIAAEDLGDRLPAMAEAQKRDYLISYVIDLKIGAKAAEAAKVGESADFQRRVAYFRQKVLLDEYLTGAMKAALTEEAARKVYAETIKDMKPEEEVRARHILVEDEGEAKKIAERVKKEDFAKLAIELSKDPGSGKEGGDLGFFTKERMVKEFADAAFALKVGEVSAPVKSQFGWHVIKLEERRAQPIPSYEEVKPQIDNFLARKAQQDIILALREKAKIERLDQPATPAPGSAPSTTPAEPKKN